MKYTKEQLQAMSDFKVNKALAELVGDFEAPPKNAATEVLGDKLFYRDGMGNYCECHPSYCDQPNDIMSLAFEHKICLIDSEIGWISFLFKDTDGDLEFEDENPLRAIACCLILVLQGEEK